MFGRVKSLDAILATAEKKGLHRSLDAFQLTLLGIGAVIGTGIFVLTSEAAQKAGPGMLLSFVVAGFVCAVAALCYSELASMVPVSGSAYTYSYAVVGEILAWMVGWALILEYAVGASAVAVGWSNHAVGLLHGLGLNFPASISNADALMAHMQLALGSAHSEDLDKALEIGGWVNVPAIFVTAIVTWLLVIGTKESARFNAALVIVKIVALTAFIALTLPVLDANNFNPFMPTGFGNPLSSSGLGVLGAAASIFFAYVGFDAVSTAAEETKNPQRNVPIGLIGSLLICTVFYLLVASGAIGAIGAQPVTDAAGMVLSPGSPEMAGRCASIVQSGAIEPLVCSKEALVHVLDVINWPLAWLVGLAAVIALPSVVLMMMFGQTRVFFTMARDGLLPEKLATVHPRFHTPHVVTIVTGIAAAFAAAVLPVGKLADYSNAGTLFAFMMVAISVMVLRRTDPGRKRPFRAPLVWIIAPAAIIGCVTLYLSLPLTAKLVLPVWGAIGLAIYFGYSRSRSHVGRGIIDVPELDPDAPPIFGTADAGRTGTGLSRRIGVRFDFEAYRARIGLGVVRADQAGLRILQQAHMRAIPFENFDPLLGKVPKVDLAGIYTKIVEGRRGGYCFEQNTLFDAALKAAGFSTRRALARVRMRFGTEAARSHLVLLVEVEGRVWLADVGFGGPGSLVPVLLEIGVEQPAPDGTYRLSEDAERGETVLERREEDGWLELYAFDRSRVSNGEIAAANYVCATWSEAPFGSHLLLGCFVGDVRYGVFDRSVSIERAGRVERREFSDFEDFAGFIEGEACIALGRDALAKAWRKIAPVQ